MPIPFNRVRYPVVTDDNGNSYIPPVAVTPIPTASSTVTPTPTCTPTPTATTTTTGSRTPSVSITGTPTGSGSATPIPTQTPSTSVTATTSVSRSPSASVNQSPTPTPSNTATVSLTNSNTTTASASKRILNITQTATKRSYPTPTPTPTLNNTNSSGGNSGSGSGGGGGGGGNPTSQPVPTLTSTTTTTNTKTPTTTSTYTTIIPTRTATYSAGPTSTPKPALPAGRQQMAVLGSDGTSCSANCWASTFPADINNNTNLFRPYMFSDKNICSTLNNYSVPGYAAIYCTFSDLQDYVNARFSNAFNDNRVDRIVLIANLRGGIGGNLFTGGYISPNSGSQGLGLTTSVAFQGGYVYQGGSIVINNIQYDSTSGDITGIVQSTPFIYGGTQVSYDGSDASYNTAVNAALASAALTSNYTHGSNYSGRVGLSGKGFALNISEGGPGPGKQQIYVYAFIEFKQ